jgi:hypothetical protein
VDLDHEALRAACFEAARKTMEDARPTDVEKIQRLADTFYHFARDHVSRIKAQGRDPGILVRAVDYLGRTHALSQMHDSTEWFFFMLRALVELTCPDGKQSTESIRFFADVVEGIRLAKRDAGRTDQS